MIETAYAGLVFIRVPVCLSSTSPLHLCSPIDHNGEGCGDLDLHYRVEQKPLSIIGHRIGSEEGVRTSNAKLKERRRRGRCKVLSALYWCGHQLAVRRIVEQLLPISPPAR